MHSQWPKFLPPTEDLNSSLLGIICSHPCDQCRIASCKVVTAFFADSLKYCNIAEVSNRSSSFTSLSQLLADMISSTIEYLIKALKCEEDKQVVHHILVSLCTVIKNCPLKNLEPKIIRILYSLISNRLRKGLESEFTYQLLDCFSGLVEPLETIDHGELIQAAFEAGVQFSVSKDVNVKISCLNLICSISFHSPLLIWCF
jgi:hypothetical protein